MNVNTALEWATGRRHGVLITNRKDGRSQSSDIVYNVNGDTITISSMDGRVKTKNIGRDPRVIVHVSVPNEYSYVSFDGVAELSPVAADANDATADSLVAYYETFHSEAHPDWAEYRAAMVEEGRLLIMLRPTTAVGEIYIPPTD